MCINKIIHNVDKYPMKGYSKVQFHIPIIRKGNYCYNTLFLIFIV